MSDLSDLPDKDRLSGERDWMVWGSGVVLAIGLTALAMVFRPYSTPSNSMAPTLVPGDYFLASRIGTPARGDVIVFSGGGGVQYVKRLIGMPGDRVQMVSGRLHLNGAPVARADQGAGEAEICWNGSTVSRVRETIGPSRSYIVYDCGPRGDLDETSVYLVPKGHYFVMGDNRDNSLDSRVSQEALGLGFVSAESVVGRAKVIVWSWDRGLKGDRTFKPVP